MADIDTQKLTITEAHDALVRGDFSVGELTHAYLETAQEHNPTLNAYLELYGDVDQQIEHAESVRSSTDNPLAGMPLAVKDNILIHGKTASSASKMLEQYTATYTATAAQKLIDAGSIFLGRTNMDEFAMGSSTENSAFGPTANPHAHNRVPGGSSGGSAAAVGGGLAIAALGSDTGGSIRQPASFCGCYGLKPTYGAVSRHGLMAMGSSFDQIGPITRSLEDAQTLFNAIRGRDPFDSTTINTDTYPARPVTGALKVGVPTSVMDGGGIHDGVRAQFDSAVATLKANGAEIHEVTLPSLEDVLATYYVLIPAEISANMARYDGVRYGMRAEGKNLLETYMNTRAEGLGPEVKRRIMIGTYMLSAGYHDAYYNNAQALRQHIRTQFDALYEEVDVIVTPTAPTPAFKQGEKTSDPLAMYLGDIFTVTANITGMPALSVPHGTVEDDGDTLPFGFQFMAAHGQEETLFTAGNVLEKV